MHSDPQEARSPVSRNSQTLCASKVRMSSKIWPCSLRSKLRVQIKPCCFWCQIQVEKNTGKSLDNKGLGEGDSEKTLPTLLVVENVSEMKENSKTVWAELMNLTFARRKLCGFRTPLDSMSPMVLKGDATCLCQGWRRRSHWSGFLWWQ